MLENVRFQRWFSEKFSGGIAPRSPYWGGATAPLPRHHPTRRSGASRLPRFARDLRSLHRQAVIWDDFRHSNPEMLPAPLAVTICKQTVHIIEAIVWSVVHRCIQFSHRRAATTPLVDCLVDDILQQTRPSTQQPGAASDQQRRVYATDGQHFRHCFDTMSSLYVLLLTLYMTVIWCDNWTFVETLTM